ncbi:hypothetical protein [Texcoconibacillus texcoconensis]|uniref:Carbonic anhydrase n=1 Tax=Texcoconibacillus texcoconensis TaxID=1095777 RepID=A0A840QPP0_9BACI|nr:hypothetical protein [Texcoconibacillus texcoconensis]MBB5173382.1 carbonic anhydrase [Texcoconibacillus texcoconensis]
MANTNNSVNSKILIITNLSEDAQSLFPRLTNKKREQFLITNHLTNTILDPYGNVLKDVMMAIYEEDIQEIYLICEKHNRKGTLSKEKLLSSLEELDIAPKDQEGCIDWLTKPKQTETTIQENINVIQQHPLMPASVSVYGFAIHTETGDYEAIETNS